MEIEPLARAIFAGTALVLAAVIVEFIRRGHVKEKYLLLWAPLAIGLMGFGLFPSLLVRMAGLLHLHYFTVALLCVVVWFTAMLLYFTMRLSQLREELKKVSRELAVTRQMAQAGESAKHEHELQAMG